MPNLKKNYSKLPFQSQNQCELVSSVQPNTFCFCRSTSPDGRHNPKLCLGARPFFSKRLLRARHDVQRPWTARIVPLLTPDIIFFFPSLICKQRPDGSAMSSLVRSYLGVWASCLSRAHTNFRATRVVKPKKCRALSCHL